MTDAPEAITDRSDDGDSLPGEAPESLIDRSDDGDSLPGEAPESLIDRSDDGDSLPARRRSRSSTGVPATRPAAAAVDPHRMSYIVESPKFGGSSGSTEPFTDIPTMSDEDGLVIARGELVYAVLNLYPYNPGHLMVVPYRRVSELRTSPTPRPPS